VNILYGAAAGLSGSGSQLFSQDTEGVGGETEDRDNFGAALAAGDFNGDGFTDLAIGVPGENIEGIPFIDINGVDAGTVNVLYGSAAGLTAAGDQRFSQDTPDVEGGAEHKDYFGAALAVGDFNGDGFADLAVGVPAEDIGTIRDAGAVHVLYGAAAGLTGAGDQLFSQDSPDVLDMAEAGPAGFSSDVFGDALAAGDFNGDGFADLAVGVPGEDIGTIRDAGAVHVLYGSAAGLSTTVTGFFHQDFPGILGEAETGDCFGEALAAGDFDNDGFADLAIGVPIEAIGTIISAGAVNVLYASANGLSAAGNQLFSQDTPGILGAAELGDAFGHTLEFFPPGEF
jgi:hypothetical protein